MSQPVPKLQAVERAQKRELPAFRVGDTVRVHYRIREGDKERVQVFQGVVIRRKRGGAGASFTVRKVSYGVGVERIFPMSSPRIEQVEVAGRGHVRRARLYYLRSLRGKKARLRESVRERSRARGTAAAVAAQPAAEPQPPAEAPAPAEDTSGEE